jgi:hypothetical protein
MLILMLAFCNLSLGYQGLSELTHRELLLRNAATDWSCSHHHFVAAAFQRSRQLLTRLTARLRYYLHQLQPISR